MNSTEQGLTIEDFARAIGVKPESIRVHMCLRGSYYGIRPAKLPNKRLLWPRDALKKFLSLEST